MSTLPLFAVIADAHIARAPGIQDRFLEAALAEAKSAGARFAVIAGDLVEDGHHSSFTNAKAILSASGLPCYPVIGNKEVSQNSPQRYISNFGPTYYTCLLYTSILGLKVIDHRAAILMLILKIDIISQHQIFEHF